MCFDVQTAYVAGGSLDSSESTSEIPRGEFVSYVSLQHFLLPIGGFQNQSTSSNIIALLLNEVSEKTRNVKGNILENFQEEAKRAVL